MKVLENLISKSYKIFIFVFLSISMTAHHHLSLLKMLMGITKM